MAISAFKWVTMKSAKKLSECSPTEKPLLAMLSGLPRCLDDAIVLLVDADDVPTDEGGDPRAYVRPWIAASCDPDFGSWEYLIDLARDSYLALANRDASRASTLLQRWSASQSSLFRRLALHGAH